MQRISATTLHHVMRGLAAAALLTLGAPPAQAQQVGFLGEIKFFAGNFAPRGWALCNGQLLAISQFSALFSILGTTYGGDGRTTFALPDMRGRVPIHAGSGPGLSPYRLGQKSGVEMVTLTVAQIPSHTHTAALADASVNVTATLRASSSGGTTNVPTGATLADDGSDRIYSSMAPDVDMHPDHVTVTGALASPSVSVGATGGNQPFTNVQPYVTVNCIIAMQGIYPSRN